MSNQTTLEKTTTRPIAVSKVSENYTAKVGTDVRNLLAQGNLVLPADYSVENALKFAWLALQEVQDKDKNPALRVCTPESVVNSLFTMVAQGLTVEKKQGYFMVYGKSLAFQRSYFGDMALAKRVRPGIEFYYGVVRKDEEFTWTSVAGRTIVSHKASLDTLNNPIVAAYCGVLGPNGEDLGADIMTMERIKKSWSKSKTAHFKESTHNEFPEEMVLRTVIRHRAKAIINSSSDAELLKAVEQSERVAALAAVNVDAAENANGELLSLDASTQSGEVIEMPVAREPEPVPVEAQLDEPDPYAEQAAVGGDDEPEYMK